MADVIASVVGRLGLGGAPVAVVTDPTMRPAPGRHNSAVIPPDRTRRSDGEPPAVDRSRSGSSTRATRSPPAELEGLLLTHPAIADAAVIGIPDEPAGEVPKAFVVPSAPLTPEEVTAFVAERVAPYKKVRAVEIIEEIPKAPSGKILRRVLIERERAAMPTG
jgi:acyl-CoA synthetase (AMP-forming)/AMP-acid ligase II